MNPVIKRQTFRLMEAQKFASLVTLVESFLFGNLFCLYDLLIIGISARNVRHVT